MQQNELSLQNRRKSSRVEIIATFAVQSYNTGIITVFTSKFTTTASTTERYFT